MRSNLAIAMSLLRDDRVVLRTLALWRVLVPKLDTSDGHPGYVGYLVETYGWCS